MKRFLIFLLPLVGCAAMDRASVYTEGGVEAAEKGWDRHFHERADECESKFEPKTPAMEGCFGDTYDADAAVERGVRSIVALLRVYWTARAAGESPDWGATLSQVVKIIDDLPPEAKAFFDKVRGIK